MHSRYDWNKEVREQDGNSQIENKEKESIYWSAEKGGCEGMKTIRNDNFSISDEDGVEKGI